MAKMWIASWFLGDDYTVKWHGQKLNYDQMMVMAKKMPADELTGEFLSALSTVAMGPYIWLIVAISMCLWPLGAFPRARIGNTAENSISIA